MTYWEPLMRKSGMPRQVVWGTILMFCIATFAACGSEETAGEADVEDGGTVSLLAVAENPKEFYGQTVTVGGTVIDILEPGAFVIDDPQTSPNEDMLVLKAGGSEQSLTEGQSVKVSGELRRFDVSEVEPELHRDLDNDLYGDFAQTPAVLANSIEERQKTTGEQ